MTLGLLHIGLGKIEAERGQPGPGLSARITSTGAFLHSQGHGVIYEWKCVGNKGVISNQIETVDPRGFIAGNWKQLD
jgi:hypothetical protein